MAVVNEKVAHAELVGGAATTLDSMMASRAYDTGTPSVSVDTTNANLLAHVVGILRNGNTQGNVTIRFAAETTGIVKVMTGSVLRYRQTN